MTYQRRRMGFDATFYPIKKIMDGRGNEKKVHDDDNPLERRVWQVPQRGGKAEVIGQQTINVVRLGVADNIPGVELNSRVLFDGSLWDVVTPPALHHGGGRHTKHWTIDVRERP